MALFSEQKNFHLKLALVGPEGGGKTALRKRYMGQGFEENYKMTFGADVSHKLYTHGSSKASAWVSIWDLAGQHEFKKMRQYYITGSTGAFLVIDSTNKSNLDKIEWWRQELKENLNQIFFFIGILVTKQDLEDHVEVIESDIDAIQEKLKKIFEFSNLDYTIVKIKSFKTSSKTGEGVEKALNWVIENCLISSLEEAVTGSY